VSSESSCALRLARHSQMHGLDTSNVSSRVESSQVEFEPIQPQMMYRKTYKSVYSNISEKRYVKFFSFW